jgi:transcriptional regulator with XRE-family HTH domain
MEPIIDYLKRRLKEEGPTRWEAIAEACGVAKTLPRKIAYEDRENPGVQTIQPILDYFHKLDGIKARTAKRNKKQVSEV